MNYPETPKVFEKLLKIKFFASKSELGHNPIPQNINTFLNQVIHPEIERESHAPFTDVNKRPRDGHQDQDGGQATPPADPFHSQLSQRRKRLRAELQQYGHPDAPPEPWDQQNYQGTQQDLSQELPQEVGQVDHLPGHVQGQSNARNDGEGEARAPEMSDTEMRNWILKTNQVRAKLEQERARRKRQREGQKLRKSKQLDGQVQQRPDHSSI